MIEKIVSQEGNQSDEAIVNIVDKMVQNLKSFEFPMKAFAKERISKIFKYSFYLKMYAKAFLGEEHKVTQDLNKYWIPVSHEQLYGMLLQNLETPRTSHRTQQITDGKYTYFGSKEEAERWFKVRGVEEAKRLFQDLVKDEAKVKRDKLFQQKAVVFAKAETLAEAAACAYGCSVGKGDLSHFYDELLKNGGVLVLEKLHLMKSPVLGNTMLTNDKKVEGHKPLLHFPPSGHLKF